MRKFRYYIVTKVHKITGIVVRYVFSEYEDAKYYADRYKKDYHVDIKAIR